MRVVYVSKALTVAAYRHKIRELRRHADVTAVIPDRWDGGPPERSNGDLPEPEQVPVRIPGSNHLHHYRGAGRWLDRLDPDLVHVDEEPYSVVTWQLGRLCRRRGIPWIFFAWQNLNRRLPRPFALLQRAVFRGARGGIAGTETAARVVRGAGYRGPLEVIPQFGVDPDRFVPDPEARARSRDRLGVWADTFVVGYGGRLVEEKGVRLLLEAFVRHSSGSRLTSRLLLIGDGPERSHLVREAAEAGVEERVTFLGHLPSLEMPRAIATCDVMVLPSVGTATWTEQFGRILVEAMASGVPVVGTRCGEIPAVVGDAGSIVPPGDARALAAALDRLRDDPDLRARQAELGRSRVIQHFTNQRIADRTAQFYRQLLHRREPVA